MRQWQHDTIVPWDDELTFVVGEDPNPAQEDLRWIEFRVAKTNDGSQRNPSIWLDRIIVWSETKQAEEKWGELARGSLGEFCNAIAANCITPPPGMSADIFYRLCGGEE